MNQYSEPLGSGEKAVGKLQAVGLTLEVDPYFKDCRRNFETNRTVWPPLEYSHTILVLYHLPRFIYSNSSYPGNSYRVITISKAAMLEPSIRGLGMDAVRYAS